MKTSPRLSTCIFASTCLLSASLAAAQQSVFSVANDVDIKKSSSQLAWDMLQYYHGNDSGQTPGILPGPPPVGDYYWWQAGAMWGTLIDYWHWTGDGTYNDIVTQALQFQVGENQDYEPRNVTLSLGNDDQAFWGMAAMSAAENGFPNPPENQPQWLELAQSVFNTQANPRRHDSTCGGGMRWQVPFTNRGYSYKNSIANGCFFNLGARLARYTENTTYSDWADKTWDWMWQVGFIDHETYAIYDGADVSTDCKEINTAEFTYNNAVFTLGAAHMYNFTGGSKIWEDRINKLIDHAFTKFFPEDIAVETACELNNDCRTDMFTYKGFVHRWYSTMTQIAPFTAARVLPVLKKSAAAAVKQCTGGDTGRACGIRWATGKYDGMTGHGQEMSALAAASALLIGDAKPPLTAKSGGTSKGNPSAGGGGDELFAKHTVTVGDKAGAAIITLLMVSSLCGALGWITLVDDSSEECL